MPRVLKKTGAGTLQWREDLIDSDGDALSLDEAILLKVDGNRVGSAREDPSWLSVSTLKTNRKDGSTLLEAVFTVDPPSDLQRNTVYTFKVEGSDAEESANRTFDLKVQ